MLLVAATAIALTRLLATILVVGMRGHAYQHGKSVGYACDCSACFCLLMFVGSAKYLVEAARGELELLPWEVLQHVLLPLAISVLMLAAVLFLKYRSIVMEHRQNLTPQEP